MTDMCDFLQMKCVPKGWGQQYSPEALHLNVKYYFILNVFLLNQASDIA